MDVAAPQVFARDGPARVAQEDVPMTIHVTCPCGTRLRFKDELAGKRAKCPKCGKSFPIPAAEEGGDGSCPSCGGEWPADAVLCVACGYDRRTGKRMKPAKDDEDEEEEPAPKRKKRRKKSHPLEKELWHVNLAFLISPGIALVVGALFGLVLRGGFRPSKEVAPLAYTVVPAVMLSLAYPVILLRAFGHSVRDQDNDNRAQWFGRAMPVGVLMMLVTMGVAVGVQILMAPDSIR